MRKISLPTFSRWPPPSESRVPPAPPTSTPGHPSATQVWRAPEPEKFRVHTCRVPPRHSAVNRRSRLQREPRLLLQHKRCPRSHPPHRLRESESARLACYEFLPLLRRELRRLRSPSSLPIPRLQPPR